MIQIIIASYPELKKLPNYDLYPYCDVIQLRSKCVTLLRPL